MTERGRGCHDPWEVFWQATRPHLHLVLFARCGQRARAIPSSSRPTLDGCGGRRSPFERVGADTDGRWSACACPLIVAQMVLETGSPPTALPFRSPEPAGRWRVPCLQANLRYRIRSCTL